MTLQIFEEFPSPGLFFGNAFDLLLSGILTAQVYVYYISFPKDRVLLKAAVIGVYLAGVVQTGLALVLFGSSALRNVVPVLKVHNNEWILTLSDHAWLSITALTAAVAIIIQSLYAQRIYLISKKRWLAIIIICMSLGQLGCGILGAICCSQELAFSSPDSSSARLIVGKQVCAIGFNWAWGPLNIICDSTITVCMVTFLIRHRKRTMRHQTRSHTAKIIQIVVETGMATTFSMVGYTVLFCLWTGQVLPFGMPTYYELPGLIMSKVYSNSMLVLLNNRATIRKGRNAVESFEFVEVVAQDPEGDIQLRARS